MPIAWAIGLACLIVFLVLLYVVSHLAPPEPREITTSEKMATKEGREELQRIMDANYYRQGPKGQDFELCPECEGFGRSGHGISAINGVATSITWGSLCGSCDGTGIKSGLSYVVLECPSCDGTGVKEGVKCRMCLGTKVIRRDKETNKIVDKGEMKDA